MTLRNRAGARAKSNSVQKVLVTSIHALVEKYGKAGSTKIENAIAALVKADKARGIVSLLVAIDDATTMKGFGGDAVATVTDETATKAAIDTVLKATEAETLVIVGAGDVVCLQTLDNPLYAKGQDGDPDKVVPSDLPYASSGKASQRILDWVRPTRIVSRIPDLTGSQTSPAHLLGNLKTAATWASRTAADYGKGFVLSTQVWAGSTRQSAKSLFGAGAGKSVRFSPAEGPLWSAKDLATRLHFINCHGGEGDPLFYGEDDAGEQPDSHDSRKIVKKIVEGTVVAAECCYGAELYDHDELGTAQGICHAYLAQGTYAYLGSTTIAYGPSDPPNALADDICTLFARGVQRGLTTGESLLKTRQKFISSQKRLDAHVQKTVAQFYLLGDATVRPVVAAKPKGAKGAKAGGGGGGADPFAGIDLTAEVPVVLPKPRAVSITPPATGPRRAKAFSAKAGGSNALPQAVLTAVSHRLGDAQLQTALTFDLTPPVAMKNIVAAKGLGAGAGKSLAGKAFAAGKNKKPRGVSKLHVVFAKPSSSRPRPLDRKLVYVVEERDGKVISLAELHQK